MTNEMTSRTLPAMPKQIKTTFSPLVWDAALSQIPFNPSKNRATAAATQETNRALNDVSSCFARVRFEYIAASQMLVGTQEHKVSEEKAAALLAPYMEALATARNLLSQAVSAASFGKHKATKHKAKFSLKHRCNDACKFAEGPDCTCNCGGVNHGMGSGSTANLFA